MDIANPTIKLQEIFGAGEQKYCNGFGFFFSSTLKINMFLLSQIEEKRKEL